MYLEKLEIQGFKSFAHKNKLIFSGLISDEKRGLTAIVGPNGSGKSNIADAVRWALGEQSIKTLRGKKSEDVIFSGSDKKSQLGLAEVSLFLNNEEGVLSFKKSPIKKGEVDNEGEVVDTEEEDDSDDENKETKKEKNNLDKILHTCPQIIITRRVYRSGESEYSLNNSRCRLSDIQMLLAKANFGQKTYSVIGQGMVDNFLNSSAAERKDFFDEATGVKQFQIKRDSALNKLESSYDNLQQVDMLLSEIRPRLKSLSRQMDKLKKREELEDNLKSTQLKYYSHLYSSISSKLDLANNKYLELDKTKISKESNLSTLNEELNQIRTTDNYSKINELQPRLREILEQKNYFEKRVSKINLELESQLESRGQFDLSWLSNKSAELKRDLENIELEISSLEKSRPKQEESVLLSQLDEIRTELNKIEKLKNEVFQIDKETSLEVSSLNRLEATLAAQKEAREEVSESELVSEKNEITKSLSLLEEEIAELDAKYADDKDLSLKESNTIIGDKISKLNAELQIINQKIKQAAHSGGKEETIGRVIQDFLKQLDKINLESDITKVRKMIAEAKKKFQAEIKTILTGESDEDARRIQSLQEEIIALTEDRQKINESLNKINTEKIKVRNELSLLHDKKNKLTWELKAIDTDLDKIDLAKEDELVKQISQVSERIKVLEQKKTDLLSDNKEDHFQAKKEELENKLQECRLRDSNISERSRLLLEKKRDIENEIDEIAQKIKQNENKFDSDEIASEKNKLQEKINQLSIDEKNINTELEKLNRAKEDEKTKMFDCQKRIQNLQLEINDIANDLSNIKMEAIRQETRLEDLENNIRKDNLSLKTISEQEVDDTEVDVDKWQKTIFHHKSQLEQIGGIDEETEKEYLETKERYDFLSQQTEDLDKAIKSLEKIIKELDINIKDRFDHEFKIISEKFNEYFGILFSGGSAKISKLMLDDLNKEENRENSLESYIDSGLSRNDAEAKLAAEEKAKKIKALKKYNALGLAGIDIQATPPGKRIQSVAMLSGGERALTAIALICAIISANPSPFVVLDEVDAALDESNSVRLAKILDDLSNKTQFIVITHNRASMRKASILYGVTMKNDGVSQIISVKLDEVSYQKKV